MLPVPFADLRKQVGSGGIEMGLLGLAFHPDYVDNRRFFVYFTDLSTDSHLVELSRSTDPNLADVDSAISMIDSTNGEIYVLTWADGILKLVGML